MSSKLATLHQSATSLSPTIGGGGGFIIKILEGLLSGLVGNPAVLQAIIAFIQGLLGTKAIMSLKGSVTGMNLPPYVLAIVAVVEDILNAVVTDPNGKVVLQNLEAWINQLLGVTS